MKEWVVGLQRDGSDVVWRWCGVMWERRRGRDQERRKRFMQELARSQAATERMCRQALVIIWLVMVKDST